MRQRFTADSVFWLQLTDAVFLIALWIAARRYA